jgi:hypothetical protein
MTDRHFRKATYPLSIEDKDELAQEFAEFGYRETSDPNDADRRNFYKVEKWDAAEIHIEALLHASNDLSRAREVFATEKKRRPRGRYTLRQGIRVYWTAGRQDERRRRIAINIAMLPELLKP